MPPPLIISIFQHRGLSSKSALHIRWPKYWSFRFSISPSNEDSGLIYFRMDWFDLPAVQRTLKSLLQQYEWKASILHSAFFMVQLTSIHDYWKTIALTRWTFASKVISLLFNMLSRLAITFLPFTFIYWMFPLGLSGLISLLSKCLSKVFSNTTNWKHQFFGSQVSLWSNSHICKWLLENHSFD